MGTGVCRITSMMLPNTLGTVAGLSFLACYKACGKIGFSSRMKDLPTARSVTGDAWPILLATPLAGLASRVRGDVTTQRLIHAWQAQAVDGLTALESAPRMMVVQLNRFCSGTEPSKDTTPIVPDPRILIPCFQHPPVPNASALQVRSHQYQLCAIISHTGVRPTEGHYRAILCSFAAGQSRSGSSSSSAEAKQFWYCDDDRSPQVLNLLTDTVLSEGYFYLYYRL